MKFFEFIESLTDEQILFAVIYNQMWGDFSDLAPTGVIAWNNACEILCFDFVKNSNCPTFPPVCAWTPSSIILISDYDGRVLTRVVPRNPSEFNGMEINGKRHSDD